MNIFIRIFFSDIMRWCVDELIANPWQAFAQLVWPIVSCSNPSHSELHRQPKALKFFTLNPKQYLNRIPQTNKQNRTRIAKQLKLQTQRQELTHNEKESCWLAARSSEDSEAVSDFPLQDFTWGLEPNSGDPVLWFYMFYDQEL